MPTPPPNPSGPWSLRAGIDLPDGPGGAREAVDGHRHALVLVLRTGGGGRD